MAQPLLFLFAFAFAFAFFYRHLHFLSRFFFIFIFILIFHSVFISIFICVCIFVLPAFAFQSAFHVHHATLSVTFPFLPFCDVKIKAEGQNAIMSDVKIKIRYHGWVMRVKKMPKRAGHISSGYIPSYVSPFWSFSKYR